MKKILLYTLTLLFILPACRKNDNPKLPDLERVPTPLIKKVAGSDQVISAQDPLAFTGKFTVGLLFASDVPPQKMDVVVEKNGDKSNVKVFKADVTTFPTEVTITGQQLQDLFGQPLALGDKFDIGVNITTQDGKMFEGFPLVGSAYGAGVNNQAGASTMIRYEVVCKYDPDVYQGNFVVLDDEWGDYSPGDVVPITKIDDTHFSFVYGANNAKPIIVTVDPNTNVTSVTKQVYGDYGTPPSWPYGDISAESVSSLDNYVAPCDKIFSVKLKHTVAAGSFGSFVIKMQKQ